MDQGVITSLFTIGGLIVGAVPSTIIGIVSTRSAERRHMRETAVNAAVAARRSELELAGKIAEKNDITFYPQEAYILPMLTLLSELESGKLTEDKVKAALEKSS